MKKDVIYLRGDKGKGYAGSISTKGKNNTPKSRKMFTSKKEQLFLSLNKSTMECDTLLNTIKGNLASQIFALREKLYKEWPEVVKHKHQAYGTNQDYDFSDVIENEFQRNRFIREAKQMEKREAELNKEFEGIFKRATDKRDKEYSEALALYPKPWWQRKSKYEVKRCNNCGNVIQVKCPKCVLISDWKEGKLR